MGTLRESFRALSRKARNVFLLAGASEMGHARCAKYDEFAILALLVLRAFVKRVSRLDFGTRFRNTGAPAGTAANIASRNRRAGPKGPDDERMRQETTLMRAKRKIPEDYRPSEDEPFMSERQRAYFRRKLLSWRDEILRSTKETLQHLQDDSAQHADIADRATSETERALELRARDRQRKLIAKIDAAIARLDDGTYGYCEETGEPISLKRLDARPIATLSVEAQERHERRERVYRDE
jgi:DnaK suppressor protein